MIFLVPVEEDAFNRKRNGYHQFHRLAIFKLLATTLSPSLSQKNSCQLKYVNYKQLAYANSTLMKILCRT